MSIYSTLSVKRVVALAALAEAELGYMSDAELGDRLDAHVAHRLNNVMVTRDGGDEEEFAQIFGLDLE